VFCKLEVCGVEASARIIIEYVTIASTGNTVDFGDLTSEKILSLLASSTRGVFAGGVSPPSATSYDTIDYVTIASTGDAQDFGNLSSDHLEFLEVPFKFNKRSFWWRDSK
jgi:hypothetical protein